MTSVHFHSWVLPMDPYKPLSSLKGTYFLNQYRVFVPTASRLTLC